MELKQYQKVGVEKITNFFAGKEYGVYRAPLHRNAYILADEPGLGKTAQAIVALNNDSHNRLTWAKDKPRYLVVCPASLKLNWKREFEFWAPGLVVSVIPELPDPKSDVVIINYDRLKAFEAQLCKRKWAWVILDEAHYLKNPKAQRYQIIQRLVQGGKGGIAKSCDRVLAITGTPLLNRPKELIDLCDCLDTNILRQGNFSFSSTWSLYMRFCNAHKGPFGWDLSGASNMHELGLLISKNMLRREKSDVLTELPEKIKQIIELKVPAKEILEKIESENLIFDELTSDKGIDLALLEIEKHIAATRQDIGLSKVPQAVEIINSVVEEEGKVIVFAHHKSVIRELSTRFDDSCVVITGDTPSQLRQQYVDEFQTNPDKKIFIGNIQAAGVGITLTAAQTVVFVETSFVPGEIEQAIDRAHRIGQKAVVRALFLTLEGGLDQRILKIIEKKEKVIKKVLTAAVA